MKCKGSFVDTRTFTTCKLQRWLGNSIHFSVSSQADAPNTGLIPESDAVGVTVVLITCTYRGQEFIRIGYYVNNEYTDPELRENPPVKPNYTQVRHYIHAVLYSLMVRHEGWTEFRPGSPLTLRRHYACYVLRVYLCNTDLLHLKCGNAGQIKEAGGCRL